MDREKRKIIISDDFRRNIEGAYGEAGGRWLAGLPAGLEQACQAWGVGFVGAHPQQSFNFVGYARDAQGSEVVLKLGFPSADNRGECAALRLFGGRGAVRLLRAEPERGWMLLEKLVPGRDLRDLATEEERVPAALRLGRELWQAVPPEHPFSHAREHFVGMTRDLEGGQVAAKGLGGLLRDAEAVVKEILDPSRDRLLHGDLHHLNILSRGGEWVAIDPKGAIGDPLYDLGAFLMNPLEEVGLPDWEARTRLRLDLIAEGMGAARGLVARWAFAVAALRTRWSLDMGLDEWESAKARAELFRRNT